MRPGDAGSFETLVPCLSQSTWHFRGLSRSRPNGRVRLAGPRGAVCASGVLARLVCFGALPAWRGSLVPAGDLAVTREQAVHDDVGQAGCLVG